MVDDYFKRNGSSDCVIGLPFKITVFPQKYASS